MRTMRGSYTIAARSRQGFSLIVVLFSLAILTLLFSAASKQTLAGLQFARGEDRLLSRLDNTVSALDALSAITRPEGGTFDWRGRVLRLQPTIGLIDVNTAAPALLAQLFDGFGIGPTARERALQNVEDWRGKGHHFLRVSDFARVSGLEPTELPRLDQLTTVHSARPNLSLDEVPLVVLEHLTGLRGSKDRLAARLPTQYFSPATGANVAVFEGARRLGVIRYGRDPRENGILAVN